MKCQASSVQTSGRVVLRHLIVSIEKNSLNP
jgi:hypothetical protein